MSSAVSLIVALFTYLRILCEGVLDCWRGGLLFKGSLWGQG